MSQCYIKMSYTVWTMIKVQKTKKDGHRFHNLFTVRPDTDGVRLSGRFGLFSEDLER